MGHPSNTKWHWPRPINTPNCNSIRPVVFAQGSGDLASRHVCELSSNHEHSPWLWQTNRHDDEKHAAQLKLRSVKMNRPINSRPDFRHFFANPDKIDNKLIFADYDSKYALKYIWRVPYLEVHGKWSYLIFCRCSMGVSDNRGCYCFYEIPLLKHEASV